MTVRSWCYYKLPGCVAVAKVTPHVQTFCDPTEQISSKIVLFLVLMILRFAQSKKSVSMYVGNQTAQPEYQGPRAPPRRYSAALTGRSECLSASPKWPWVVVSTGPGWADRTRKHLFHPTQNFKRAYITKGAKRVKCLRVRSDPF